ncbi:cytochrome d ubiquinol oxidase subunit II [Numidum massiliense]|uniref:cytochrome d ubiquinol oxidase subunit II n=1 Tax=Numidum massiliense TaxID=1522315 RepID=UPI0006D558D5|nr:cytochrome d ubiquinol oxidase subunit II [Numidum massiliense]
MTLAKIGITVLWTFLYLYVIVGSIDFGAGFFSYYSRLRKQDRAINHIIDRYLFPVWEVTNVFLVFFFVGIVGFFPDTAYYFGTALLIPGSVALILLAIRGSFYAFANYGARESNVYLFFYALTSWFLPASLATVLTISEGGFIKKVDGQVQLLPTKLLFSPYSWTVVLLALVSVLFISSSFLTYYARRAEDREAEDVLRTYALGWSGPTIVASGLVFFTLRLHNPQHFQAMVDIAWVFLLSLACFVAATVLIFRRRAYGWAFLLVMLQFLFAFFGYGASHLPYILYPHVTISSVTSTAMGTALVAAFVAGLLLLIPSLVFLMRLFLFSSAYVKGEKVRE